MNLRPKRQVQAGGRASCQGRRLRLPKAVRGQSVPFRPTPTDGRWANRYLTDDLGTLVPREPVSVSTMCTVRAEIENARVDRRMRTVRPWLPVIRLRSGAHHRETPPSYASRSGAPCHQLAVGDPAWRRSVWNADGWTRRPLLSAAVRPPGASTPRARSHALDVLC